MPTIKSFYANDAHHQPRRDPKLIFCLLQNFLVLLPKLNARFDAFGLNEPGLVSNPILFVNLSGREYQLGDAGNEACLSQLAVDPLGVQLIFFRRFISPSCDIFALGIGWPLHAVGFGSFGFRFFGRLSGMQTDR